MSQNESVHENDISAMYVYTIIWLIFFQNIQIVSYFLLFYLYKVIYIEVLKYECKYVGISVCLCAEWIFVCILQEKNICM